MQASFRSSHVNLTLSQEALGLRLFDPSAYLQMPCHLRLSFSGSAASAMAVGSLSSKSSYFGHQLGLRPVASRVRSEQEQSFGVLCKPKVTFPAMVLLASGSRRRAFPPLPSLSDTLKENRPDTPERFRKPPARLRASRPNTTSVAGRCKNKKQRTADTLVLLLGFLCLELRVYPSIWRHKETLGP